MTTFVLLSLFACDDFLAREPEAEAPEDPGTRVLQRLNRTEYDNTVRDLLGTSLRPARDFPADDFGYGFDNIGDVLSMSPLHVELYDRATVTLLDELFGTALAPTERWVVEAEAAEAEATGGAPYQVTGWVLYGDDSLSTRLFLPYDGTYVVAAKAWPRAEDGAANVALVVDGASVAEAELIAPDRVEATLSLAAGHHDVAIDFLDAPEDPDTDDDLVVDFLEVTGPTDRPLPPPALASRVLSCSPEEMPEEDCALQIVRDFGLRAWRRPLSPDELQAQLDLYGQARANGGTFEQSIRASLRGILMSPNFLFRVEVDPDPDSTDPHPVNAYELASRLSYFLWSTMPDDRLFELAATGELLEEDVLEAEARRMLDDPRAVALVDNLGGQWLGIRKVEEADPDPELYPQVDQALILAMEADSHDLVQSVFLGGQPLSALVTSTTSYVDERLAEFYGIDETGEVQMPERPGLLGRPAWQMAMSHPNATSPVKRGAWILDKILCSPPPPAPDGVSTDLGEGTGSSLVEQLAQHRADPSCASCHDSMDAYGLALEGFDPIGQQRETYDDGQPVLDEAELPTGESFKGLNQLVEVLKVDPRVPRCAVEQTFTYALNRAPTLSDEPTLSHMEEVASETDAFEEMVVQLVLSRPFRWRRGGN